MSDEIDKLWEAYWGLFNITRDSNQSWGRELDSVINDIDQLIDLGRSQDYQPEPMTVEQVNEMIETYFPREEN